MNSKSWSVWTKAQWWILKLNWSVTEYEFTSQPDQAWRRQAFRAIMPVFMQKTFDEMISNEGGYRGFDEDTDADTEDSWDEDLEKKMALLKHLGGVYKKPQRRKLS
jgi:hypothetical protein